MTRQWRPGEFCEHRTLPGIWRVTGHQYFDFSVMCFPVDDAARANSRIGGTFSFSPDDIQDTCDVAFDKLMKQNDRPCAGR